MSEHRRTALEALRRALRLLALAGRTLLRGFGWTFVVLVALAAGLGLYAQRFLSPEKARVIIIEQLQGLLNREVQLERVVLAPRGIKLRGLRVRSRLTGAEDLLVCDTLLATIKLKPLLQRRVELDTLRLESPRISMIRTETGEWAIADLFTSTAAARRSALPFDLAAVETRVENGVLRVDDRLRKRKVVLDGLTARVDDFALAKPFPVSASFATTVTFGTRTVTARAEADGSLDLAGLNWSSATARADAFSAVVDGTSFSGEVEAKGFVGPLVTFEASVPAFGPEQWKRHFDRAWPLSLPAGRVAGVLRVPALGRVEVERLETRVAGGRVVAEGSVLFVSTPTLRASVRVEDLDLAQAGTWSPSWAKRSLMGRLTGRVSLAGWPGRLQAEGGEVALKGFGGVFTRHRVDGLDGYGWAADEFAVAHATVSAGRLSSFDNVFDELSGSASLRKQNLVLERLRTKWGGSTLNLKARVERVSDPKEVAVSGTLDKLAWDDAQRFVTAFRASLSTRPAVPEADRTWVRVFKYAIPKRFPDTVGHVRIGEVHQANFWCKDVDLLWTLRGVTPDLHGVNGEARLRLGTGRVADIPAVQDAHKFLKVIFLPFIFMHKMNNLAVLSAATAYPKTLDFRAIEGEYAVSRGVASTRYFTVDSGQLVAYAEGDADFGREKVDMNILTRLTGYRGAGLPEWWTDEQGRVAIGFRVKNDLNSPELEPRFSKIGSDEIEKKVSEGRARAKKRFEALEKLKTL
ncbi:MAG: AsmA-like C-terminal region-containing protein [Elusimicrobiota bacterium]|nr:AsmA-like C-terminal region-containing protein [Elusimicrobiota bacterium]